MVRMHAFIYGVASACLRVCTSVLVWVDFFRGVCVVAGPTTTLEQVKHWYVALSTTNASAPLKSTPKYEYLLLKQGRINHI